MLSTSVWYTCTPFQFFSTKSDGLVNRTKQLINQLAFGTGLRYIYFNTMSLCGVGFTWESHESDMRVTWGSYEYYTAPTSLIFSRTMSMDYTKPLLVPAGSDALGQIGMYVVQTSALGDLGSISNCFVSIAKTPNSVRLYPTGHVPFRYSHYLTLVLFGDTLADLCICNNSTHFSNISH